MASGDNLFNLQSEKTTLQNKRGAAVEHNTSHWREWKKMIKKVCCISYIFSNNSYSKIQNKFYENKKKTTVEMKRQVHNNSTDRCTTSRYLWGRRGPQWPPEWAFGTSPALSLSAAHTQCCSGLSTLLKIMATLRFNTLWNEFSSLIAT